MYIMRLCLCVYIHMYIMSMPCVNRHYILIKKKKGKIKGCWRPEVTPYSSSLPWPGHTLSSTTGPIS